jgi:hypothetical protein
MTATSWATNNLTNRRKSGKWKWRCKYPGCNSVLGGTGLSISNNIANNAGGMKARYMKKQDLYWPIRKSNGE